MPYLGDSSILNPGSASSHLLLRTPAPSFQPTTGPAPNPLLSEQLGHYPRPCSTRPSLGPARLMAPPQGPWSRPFLEVPNKRPRESRSSRPSAGSPAPHANVTNDDPRAHQGPSPNRSRPWGPALRGPLHSSGRCRGRASAARSEPDAAHFSGPTPGGLAPPSLPAAVTHGAGGGG